VDPLRIVKSELNENDPSGNSFDLHMSRAMTPLEQEAVRLVLTKKWGGSADVKAPSTVTVSGVTVHALEQRKDWLQELVSEAEAQASEEQSVLEAAEVAAETKVGDARRRAAAIDWSSKPF
jgi:hypothetical protein